MVRKLFRYLEPFRCRSPVWQTDGRTNRTSFSNYARQKRSAQSLDRCLRRAAAAADAAFSGECMACCGVIVVNCSKWCRLCRRTTNSTQCYIDALHTISQTHAHHVWIDVAWVLALTVQSSSHLTRLNFAMHVDPFVTNSATVIVEDYVVGLW